MRGDTMGLPEAGPALLRVLPDGQTWRVQVRPGVGTLLAVSLESPEMAGECTLDAAVEVAFPKVLYLGTVVERRAELVVRLEQSVDLEQVAAIRDQWGLDKGAE